MCDDGAMARYVHGYRSAGGEAWWPDRGGHRRPRRLSAGFGAHGGVAACPRRRDGAHRPAVARPHLVGVEPEQDPDFIALRGDASDRIPGATGVGAIGAASLPRKYGSLEKVLAAGRFSGQSDALRLYRSIATMDKTAPLPPLRNQKTSWAKAASLARDWQLNKLGERLDALARG